MKTKRTRSFTLLAALLCLAFAADLFAQDPRAEMMRRMMSGGGRTGTSSVQRQSAQVVAVADERSNSVIVIASTNIHNEISALISQIDANVDDVTEVRVFPLKNADPTEMSEVLSQLFSDQQQNNQQSPGFRVPFFFGGRGGGSQQALRSDQRVVAVPDPRSTSIIVSAPRQMMDQIAQMISQLDTSGGKKQQVFTYTLEHADVNNVQEILRAMFEGQNSRSARSQTQNNTSALTQRAGGFGSAGATQGTAGGGGGGGGAFGRN